LAISRRPSIWRISSEIFSCEICKTRCSMSQSLDYMHASLPDLKYRSLFFLNLLVCLMDEDLLFLIWVIFVV
jgi:hypothetical protein